MMFSMFIGLAKLFSGMRPEKIASGVLLIDKPSGISSYDAIRILQKRFGRIKMGHAGTLDPLASGLLVVGMGDGTKKLKDFLKLPKTYEAHIALGIRTDTGDREGNVLDEKEVRYIDEKIVREALKGMQGVILLPVPVYSAVKQKGVPLYRRARRGEEVSPPVKEMRITRAELLGMIRESGKIIPFVEFEVGSGTYIRSIAEELGRRLGVPATLWALRRTKIGDYDVRDAESIQPFRAQRLKHSNIL